MSNIKQNINTSVDTPGVTWRYDCYLPTPKLLYPRTGTNICLEDLDPTSANILLQWTTIVGASRYIIQWCSNNSFNGPTLRSASVVAPLTVYALVQDVDITYGETVYWRVFAIGDDGCVSSKSEPWSIKYDCNTPDGKPDYCSDYNVCIDLNYKDSMDCCTSQEVTANVSYLCANAFGTEILTITNVTWDVGDCFELLGLDDVDGFSLKSNIYSCGDKDAKCTVCLTIEFTDTRNPTIVFDCERCIEIQVNCTDKLALELFGDPNDPCTPKPIGLNDFYTDVALGDGTHFPDITTKGQEKLLNVLKVTSVGPVYAVNQTDCPNGVFTDCCACVPTEIPLTLTTVSDGISTTINLVYDDACAVWFGESSDQIFHNSMYNDDTYIYKSFVYARCNVGVFEYSWRIGRTLKVGAAATCHTYNALILKALVGLFDYTGLNDGHFLLYDSLLDQYCGTFDNTDAGFGCLAATETIEVCVGLIDDKPATFVLNYDVAAVPTGSVGGDLAKDITDLECPRVQGDGPTDYTADNIGAIFNGCTASKIIISGDLYPGCEYFDSSPGDGNLLDYESTWAPLTINCDPFQVVGQLVKTGLEIEIPINIEEGAEDCEECVNKALIKSGELEARTNLVFGCEFKLENGVIKIDWDRILGFNMDVIYSENCPTIISTCCCELCDLPFYGCLCSIAFGPVLDAGSVTVDITDMGCCFEECTPGDTMEADVDLTCSGTNMTIDVTVNCVNGGGSTLLGTGQVIIDITNFCNDPSCVDDTVDIANGGPVICTLDISFGATAPCECGCNCDYIPDDLNVLRYDVKHTGVPPTLGGSVWPANAAGYQDFSKVTDGTISIGANYEWSGTVDGVTIEMDCVVETLPDVGIRIDGNKLENTAPFQNNCGALQAYPIWRQVGPIHYNPTGTIDSGTLITSEVTVDQDALTDFTGNIPICYTPGEATNKCCYPFLIATLSDGTDDLELRSMQGIIDLNPALPGTECGWNFIAQAPADALTTGFQPFPTTMPAITNVGPGPRLFWWFFKISCGGQWILDFKYSENQAIDGIGFSVDDNVAGVQSIGGNLCDQTFPYVLNFNFALSDFSIPSVTPFAGTITLDWLS